MKLLLVKVELLLVKVEAQSMFRLVKIYQYFYREFLTLS